MNVFIGVSAAASWYLVGLGVTVGLVTYPSFALVGLDQWRPFHQHHSRRISWAVGPAWIAQAVGLLGWFVNGGQRTAWWMSAGGAGLAVLLTGGVAVGLHRQLSETRPTFPLQRLRTIHFLRTVCWGVTALATLVALGARIH